MKAEEIAFYASAAGLIPILLLAVGFQLTLERWWSMEEPIYRAIFPYLIGLVVAVMFAGEIVALAVLANAGDFHLAKAIVLVGVALPLLVLSLALISRAAEIHEDFLWETAFKEWAATSARKRAAQDRRAAERAAMRAARREVPKRTLLKDGLRGIAPPPPGWLRRRREHKKKSPPPDP